MLRPVTADDVAVLEQLTQDPEITGEFEWSGWYDLRSLQRGWDDNGLIGPDGGILMVVRDDELLGAVNWRRHETTPGAHCWEVGIELLPEARGHGYGTEAHRLLVRYLFAHTTVTGSRRSPRSATWGSGGPWRRPGSPRKGSCAGAAGETGRGATA